MGCRAKKKTTAAPANTHEITQTTPNRTTKTRDRILAAWLGLCQSNRWSIRESIPLDWLNVAYCERLSERVPVPQEDTTQPNRRNEESKDEDDDRNDQVERLVIMRFFRRLHHMNHLHIGREARSRLRHVHHLRLRCRALDAELRSRRELGELRLSSSYRLVGRQSIGDSHCVRVGERERERERMGTKKERVFGREVE